MGDDRNVLRFHRPQPRLCRPVNSRLFKRNILILMAEAMPSQPVRLKSRSNDN